VCETCLDLYFSSHIFFSLKQNAIMLDEFKKFAIQGNLVDTAVAFVMGGAFGKVTSSFIEGIVMPLVGQIGGVDFSKVKHVLVQADAAAKIDEVAVKHGEFITSVINFLIVALVMFSIIKAIAKAKAAAAAEEAAAPPPPPPPPPAQEVLLGEILAQLKAGR
jgi:large conductance mechanosensitive channel